MGYDPYGPEVRAAFLAEQAAAGAPAGAPAAPGPAAPAAGFALGGSVAASEGAAALQHERAGTSFRSQQEEQLRQLQVREQQQGLAQALAAAAAGRGPSVAQTQLQGGLDEASRQAMAIAAGQRGNPLLAQRQAIAATQGAGLQGAVQLAALRAQEMQQARGELASVLGGTREADIAGRGQYGQQALSLEELQQQRELTQLEIEANRRQAELERKDAKRRERANLGLSILGGALQTGSVIAGSLLGGPAGGAAGGAAGNIAKQAVSGGAK
jgi:hypothetical protein